MLIYIHYLLLSTLYMLYMFTTQLKSATWATSVEYKVQGNVQFPVFKSTITPYEV